MRAIVSVLVLLNPMNAFAYEGPMSSAYSLVCDVSKTCSAAGDCTQSAEAIRARMIFTNLALEEQDFYDVIIWYEDPDAPSLGFGPIGHFEETAVKRFSPEDWVENGVGSPFDYSGKTAVVRWEQSDVGEGTAVIELFETTPGMSQEYRVRTLKCELSTV